MNHEVKSIAYHRNGICGAGFHVAIVESEVEPGDTRKMLVVTFGADEEPGNGYATAVFDMALLAKDNIEFGENSWRGDHWHPFMCHEAIPDYRAQVDKACGILTDEERFPLTDWQDEVRNGDTRLGYREWLQHRKESEQGQAEGKAVQS
jgi:hypothetical protein